MVIFSWLIFLSDYNNFCLKYNFRAGIFFSAIKRFFPDLLMVPVLNKKPFLPIRNTYFHRFLVVKLPQKRLERVKITCNGFNPKKLSVML